MDIQGQKKNLRSTYLPIRDKLHNKETDHLIINRFLSGNSYHNSSSIFITLSFGSEINTFPIIKKALEDNKRVFVPKIDENEKKMIPVEIKSIEEDLIEGPYHILEPKEIHYAKKEPDLIIVPGLVFSTEGFRVGYGGGYYDRYLGLNDYYSVSLVYEDLLVNTVPVEEFDQKVNEIITEKRNIQCC